MVANRETQFTQDVANKRIIVVRKFEAPVAEVWRYWTEPEKLDQWWAPKPWKAVTNSMNFEEGGDWSYSMVSPEGEKHYCRVQYKKIDAKNYFIGDDSFCDENGNVKKDMPSMNWKCEFTTADNNNNTLVTADISFNSEADMDKILEMGFKEGFTAALGNLDEVLDQSKQGVA